MPSRSTSRGSPVRRRAAAEATTEPNAAGATGRFQGLEPRAARFSKPWKARRRPVIRRATSADLKAVLRLDAALIRYDRRFDPTLDPGWTRSADGRRFYADHVAGGGGVVFVAFAGRRAVAYLVGAVGAAEEFRLVRSIGEVECLYAEPAWRDSGLGRRLLRRFEAWARRRGAERMRVVVSEGNCRAIRFYEREGYERHDAVLERPLRRRRRTAAARTTPCSSPASRRRSKRR